MFMLLLALFVGWQEDAKVLDCLAHSGGDDRDQNSGGRGLHHSVRLQFVLVVLACLLGGVAPNRLGAGHCAQCDHNL